MSSSAYGNEPSSSPVPPPSAELPPLFDPSVIVSGDGGRAIDIGDIPEIVSLPDCNFFRRCANCDRGSTSTGIPCPNCGFVNVR